MAKRVREAVDRLDDDLEAMRAHAALDPALVERAHAEAGARALFDLEPEAAMARMDEAASERALFRTPRVLREVEADPVDAAPFVVPPMPTARGRWLHLAPTTSMSPSPRRGTTPSRPVSPPTSSKGSLGAEGPHLASWEYPIATPLEPSSSHEFRRVAGRPIVEDRRAERGRPDAGPDPVRGD